MTYAVDTLRSEVQCLQNLIKFDEGYLASRMEEVEKYRRAIVENRIRLANVNEALLTLGYGGESATLVEQE